MSESGVIHPLEIRRRQRLHDEPREVLGPRQRPFLSAEWRHLAMLNFEIDPLVLRPWLPVGTELDAWRGTTYVSLVGFMFHNLRVWNCSLPFTSDFPEVNLRFYVRRKVGGHWRRAVVFVKEFAPRWLVARAAGWFYDENYSVVRMKHVLTPADGDGDVPCAVSYSWHYAARQHTLRISTCELPRALKADSLEAFIVDQAWGYSGRPGRPTIEYRVEHPAWRICEASEAVFDGDAAALYGEPFGEALARPPASAFLVEGSAISLFKGVKVATP